MAFVTNDDDDDPTILSEVKNEILTFKLLNYDMSLLLNYS